jgi:hypothetical protein
MSGVQLDHSRRLLESKRMRMQMRQAVIAVF